ncbi:FecR family protein [Pedobacter foliorum]|uniref:FecR family protein n=1 Tax=Pedobacter foliorum TaxID=2739058 RepID=UPI001563254E|nr:FecR family protein [Pedobacter foliorum]NRF41187.1 FecR family protein [Pedobacter foliorum]
MDKQQFLALIDKYLAGDASMEEEQMLLNYYGSFQDTTVWDEKVLGVKQEIEQKMFGRIQDHIKQTRVKEPVRLWPRIAVAASVVIALSTAIYFYTTRQADGRRPELVSGSLDILPGKNTATITLADGSTIVLSEAKSGVVVSDKQLRYNDSTEVNSATANKSVINGRHPETSLEFSSGSGPRIIQTPRGGTYQITLPDGTKVWLNAASSLKFPSTFHELGKRKVELSGEAYFEVAKDKSHPFIVTTDKQSVEVLGTHFNINSYADEAATKTTLLEGSVKVSASAINGRHPELGSGPRTAQSIILKPDQEAVLTTNQLAVKNINPEDAIDWKNGQFVLRKESLQEIMRKVERWYNVDVIYKGEIEPVTFSGSVSRFDKVSTLLGVLEKTKKVHFSIEGNKIIVEKYK